VSALESLLPSPNALFFILSVSAEIYTAAFDEKKEEKADASEREKEE